MVHGRGRTGMAACGLAAAICFFHLCCVCFSYSCCCGLVPQRVVCVSVPVHPSPRATAAACSSGDCWRLRPGCRRRRASACSLPSAPAVMVDPARIGGTGADAGRARRARLPGSHQGAVLDDRGPYCAIVIAGDAAGADVRRRRASSQRLIGLAAGPSSLSISTNFSDVHAATRTASGRRRAEGPMRQCSPITAFITVFAKTSDCFSMRVFCMDAIGAHLDARAEMHLADQHRVHVDASRSTSLLWIVDARKVRERRAVQIRSRCASLAVVRLHLAELHLVVDAHATLIGVCAWGASTRTRRPARPRRPRRSDNIRAASCSCRGQAANSRNSPPVRP